MVEGQGGDDALDFNGSNAGEEIALSANGSRVRLTRNIAAITMDFDGIESAVVRALGATDTITVDDLTGTDLEGGRRRPQRDRGGGDGSADTVVINGTDKRDVREYHAVRLAGADRRGCACARRIVGSEAANDTLRVNTLGGNDDVTVAPDVERSDRDRRGSRHRRVGVRRPVGATPRPPAAAPVSELAAAVVASVAAMATPSSTLPIPQRLAAIREQLSLLADYL